MAALVLDGAVVLVPLPAHTSLDAGVAAAGSSPGLAVDPAPPSDQGASGSTKLTSLEPDPAIHPLAGVSPDVPIEPGDVGSKMAKELAVATDGQPVSGFDPLASTEVVSERSEFASVFDNPDGTSTAVVSLEPQYFRDAAGQWAKIDARLAPVVGEPGVFETVADSVRVRADGAGVSVLTPKGRTITFSPIGDAAKLSSPTVSKDGLSVTYRDVWPGVDLRFRVSAATVTKEIVLTRPGTQASFELAVSGLGLMTDATGRLTASGQVADEVKVGDVVVTGADGAPLSPEVVGSFAKADMAGDGSLLTLGVDPGWLASLDAKAFPLVVDPQVNIGNMAGYSVAWARDSGGTQVNSCGVYQVSPCGFIYAGNASTTGLYRWRSVFAFDYQSYLPTSTMSSRLVTAAIQMNMVGGTTNPAVLYVRRATAFTWCGIYGDPNGCAGANDPWTSAIVGTGAVSVDVTSMINAGNYWSQGAPNIGWGFNGDEASGVYTAKWYSGMQLALTYDRTAIVTSRSPADQTVVNDPGEGLTLTAQAAAGPDPGQQNYYHFAVCRTQDYSNCVYDSGWTTNPSPTVWSIGSAGIPYSYYNQQFYWSVQTVGTNPPGANDNIVSTGWYQWRWQNRLPSTLPALVSPADGFVWSPPTTVVLRAGAPPPDPENDPLFYRFIVRERGAVGVAVRSQWVAASSTSCSTAPLTEVCWTIPTTAPLTPGLMYEWTIELGDYSSIGLARESSGTAAPRSARFQQRFGSSGPSPYETVGPVTVNLANGNEYTSVSAGSFATATGSIGAVLEYNSNSSATGLLGSYTDAASHSTQRIDPTINFAWASQAPVPGFTDAFNVVWTGYLTVPTSGTYYFGAGSDDSVTVTVNNVQVLSQGCCVDASFAATQYYHTGSSVRDSSGNQVGTAAGVVLNANQRVPIRIDYADAGGPAHLELYTGTNNQALSIVPSDWLAPTSLAAPLGWSFAAAVGVGSPYTLARVEASQILLTQTDGDTIAFQLTAAGGFSPPPGVLDHVTLNSDGTVLVSTADGAIIHFTTTGQLDTYAASADTGGATTTFTYTAYGTGGEQRLTSETDATSGKSLSFAYYNGPAGAGATCPATGTFLAATDPLVAGMLCSIRRPDSQHTDLWYYAQGGAARLRRMIAPGSQQTDLLWSGAALTTISTPYLNDLYTAGKLAGTEAWILGYTSGKVTSITAPIDKPAATTREGITITWSTSALETLVKTNNLDTIYGTAAAWDRWVTFDNLARWTGDWTARATTTSGSTTNSLEQTAVWHPTADIMLEQRANGRLTSYVYDQHLWLTDTYGPANISCFTAITPLPTSPPYRSETTNGTCSPAVPHTHTDYDTTLAAGGSQTAMLGLSQTSWPNPSFAGSPASVQTFNPGSIVTKTWGTGAPPGIPTDTWSTQLTGDINLDIAGTWGFWITMADPADTASLYVDDQPAIPLRTGDFWGTNWYVSYGELTNLTIGTHRLRVQYVDNNGGVPNGANASLQINWNRPGTGNAVMPTNALAPAFGLPTRTTIDDSNGAPASVTHTRYDENGWDPAYGLATSTVADPAGAALTTSTTYDTALRRRLSRTLPGANTTNYVYYGNTEASPAVTCSDGSNIPAGVNQGGLLKTATSPTPASGTAIVYESVYDVLGRVVATRTGSDPWSCTTYDTRDRVTHVAYPANATAAARTVDTSFADTTDPQTVVVTDSSLPAPGTSITKSDFLGRTIESTDVWGVGNKVTTVYDSAGRVSRRYGTTIGATGTSQGLEYTYERGGLVSQVKLDGQPIAIPTYTSGTLGGELASVSYPSGTGNAGNGTQGAIGRGQTGAITGLTWNQNGGALLTSDTVLRSQSGRVLTDTIDGAGQPAWTYTYDAAGRLANAVGSGHNYSYGYASTGGCGANTAAGKNSNRTSLIDNSITLANYCYDNADRLTSTTQSGYTGTITYDTHGNTTQIAGQALTYDSANRHIGTYLPNTTSPTTSVVYQRDANDGLVSRTATVTTTGGSTPAFRAAASAATNSGGGATTLAINRPAGTVTGDVLIAALTIRTGTGTAVTPPTGWTQIADSVAGTNVRTLTYWRTAAAGDPASWTWTLASAWPMAGGIAAYSGVNTTTPIDATAIDNHTNTTTTHTAPSVTTTVPGDLHLVILGGDNRTTTTPPATMSERVDTTTGSNNGATVHLSDRVQPTTGSTGTAVVTSADAIRATTTTVTLKAAVINTTTVTTLRYSFGAALDTTNNVIERTIALPGGVILTKRATGDVWSYPNIHGDIQAVANTAGAKQGSTYTYDPFGQPLTGVVDNEAGNIDNAWLGKNMRPYEHETGLAPLIEMGARGYNLTVGRFLQTDPVEGGSANNYDYANGDPVNNFDLDGLCSTHHTGLWGKVRSARCHASHAVGATGRAINHYRWELAGVGVGLVCVGSGGVACAGAASLLFVAKSASTASAHGGWRDYAANAISSYAFFLPGAGLTGEFNTVAWRAIAEGAGFLCSFAHRCASPSHL